MKIILFWIFCFAKRTIGEIIEEDIGEKGIALGLNDEQIRQCINHNADSYEWAMKHLEDNLDQNPNYRIKVSYSKSTSAIFNCLQKCVKSFFDSTN